MPLGAFRLNSLGRIAAEEAAPTRDPVTVTAVGDAQLDTAQKEFGTASLLLDGSGDYALVSGQDATYWDLSGDFTIEFWMYPTSVTSTTTSVLSNGWHFIQVTYDGSKYVRGEGLTEDDLIRYPAYAATALGLAHQVQAQVEQLEAYSA